jgi:alcohol dehydrogenase class IV
MGNDRTDYFVPTRIAEGEGCLLAERRHLAELGTKALIVTGRRSARANGSLADAEKALAENGQQARLFDQVDSNPTVACVLAGAELARREGCDFVIGIGGGSPMDAAKAIAALALQPGIKADGIFDAPMSAALPIAAVPTTAGTGSELTPYSILTNDKAETKTSVASNALFPRVAFLDARYTYGLPRNVTVNTAIDAMCHAVEGMLSARSSFMTDTLALESLSLIGASLVKLARLGNKEPDADCRRTLLRASALAGMVIANTGTTAVHAMGYGLTYHRHIDHGRANGLLLARYLRFVEGREKEADAGGRKVADILKALGFSSVDGLASALDTLLGEREAFTDAELRAFAAKAITAKNIANCRVKPSEADILAVMRSSMPMSN